VNRPEIADLRDGLEMDPSKYRPALNMYCKLMEEAKHRLSAMDTLLAGRSGLPVGAAHEFLFLQLRMLCELIALACLTAHGDAATLKQLKRIYDAGKIMRQLERLHPHFYPHAAEQTKSEPDKYDAVLRTGGFLTKTELGPVFS
jgi:hypothetical protein